MKVKIFSSSFNKFEDAQEIELAINEWLKSNPSAKIKFVTHSETCGEGDYWITISIWYEENLSPQ